MDDLYFDWRSQILANRAESEGLSLLELLDIIPTDIPRNASEFDEEIRNLIISLYSDAKQTDQLSTGNEYRESNTALRSMDQDKDGMETDTGEHSVKTTSHVPGISNVQMHQQEFKMSHDVDTCNTEGSLGISKVQHKDGTPHDTENVVAEPLFHNSMIDCNEKDKFEKGDVGLVDNDGSNADSKSVASLLMQYDQNQLKILHDKSFGGLSNEITKDCPLQDAIETHIQPSNEHHSYACSNERPTSIQKDDMRQEFKATANRLNSIEQQKPENSQNGDYQQNLDDLGDSKTATILSSVTGWLSTISRDSSKDFLGSMSLLEDLPSEVDVDASGRDRVLRAEKRDSTHGMSIFGYEVEDHCSVPSEVSKLDEVMLQHPLCVIEEENDNSVSETAEFELIHSSSDASLLSESLKECDSGLGSLSVLTHLDEIQSNFKVEPILNLGASSQTGLRVELDHDDDAVMAQLEQKLESVGKFDKKRSHSLNMRPSNDFEQLSADYSKLLQEKMALKKAIWDLEENLSFEKKIVEVNKVEKSDILNQKAEIESAVLELEDKVRHFEVECRTRDGKLREVVEKLNDMNKCHEKLKEQSEKTEKELKSKCSELEKTKTELKGYVSACNAANEYRDKCESQLKLLTEAFQKMKQSRDWLEFQLKTLSDSRAKMQLEFEESKAEESNKASAILELQAENKNLSAKLVEINFASGKEKKEILKGMEKVEEQILEHRACFAELEKKNEALLHLLKEKDDVIEKDGVKIRELINIVADAEDKMKELRAEVIEKEGLLESLKQEFTVVQTRIEECEELIKSREEEKISLLSKNTGLEEQVLELGDKIKTKEHDLSRIVEEKATVQSQLEAANDEKIEFERAVLLLKKDMQKVNLIFQVMKKDLASKSSMLLAIDKKKQELLKEMKDLQDYMSDQSQMQEELRTTLREKMDLIRELSCQKEELACETKMLRDHCSSLQTELKESIKAREAIEMDANNARSTWMEEEDRFRKEISTLRKDHDALVTENAEKEQCLVAMKEESKIVASNLERLKKDNQKEIANLRAKENKLHARLKEMQKEWLLKEENYEASILSLVNKLKHESIARQNVDKMVAEQSELMKMKKCEQQLIFAKVKEVFKCFNSMKDEKDAIKRELLQFKDSSSKLCSFLVNMVSRMCKQIEEGAISNENLIGEIEELKAELKKSMKGADVLRNQVDSQRTRTSEYEKECEKREAEIRTLKQQIVVLKKERDIGLKNLNQCKKNTESKLLENDSVVVNYRKQIEELQNENSLIVEKCDAVEKHLSKLKDEAQEKDLKVSELETSLNESLVAGKAEEKEKSVLTAAYNELQGVIFSLENQLSIERSQTRVLEDQIRNLKWQHKQAKSEAKTKKEELEMLKSQHEAEVQDITSLLSVAKTEVACLRDENSEIRREKQKCSGQLIESQDRLRRQGGDLDKLRNEVRKRNGELMRLKEDMKDCKSAATREMLDYIVKKAVIDVSNSKETENGKYTRELAALKTLRKCMLGLSNEMDSLHSEMSSQMDHLQGSKSKIKKFQENLGGLQTACKSLHEKSSNIQSNEAD